MKVPCNGCTLCCLHDAVRLSGDEVERFHGVPHPILRGQWMLPHNQNGECIYLMDKGCGVHPDKPLLCQTMDCRNLAHFTYTQARKLAKRGVLNLAVWRRGRELNREKK